MIYLVMCGRLGNQLFQYAFARKIQLLTGQKLAIDFTAINNVHNDAWKNYLDYYNVSDYEIIDNKSYYPIQRFVYRILKKIKPTRIDRAFKFDTWSMKYLSKYGVIYCESTFKTVNIENIRSKNIIIRGWFESEDYFEEIKQIILREYTPKKILSQKNLRLMKKLVEEQSICVTVRRGNFTLEKLRDKYLVCNKQYYVNGVDYIRKKYSNALVYVCSDDIEWCKQNLGFDGNVIYEDENEIWEKLYLMSLCKHFVISNSTFSWWAQYLSSSEHKIVIAPEEWRNEKFSPQNIYQDTWIKMTKDGLVINQ